MSNIGDNKLRTRALGREWVHFDSVDSTNEYIKQRALELENGFVVSADFQSKGRGRRGNSWSTSAGNGLAMSMLIKPYDISTLSCLPLVGALAVQRAVYGLTGLEAAIKWPNDIVLGNKKLCGILCESVQSGDRELYAAICGIGVNIGQTENEFIDAGIEHATSLYLQSEGKCPTAKEFAVSVLNELEPLVDRLIKDGFSSMIEEYARYCITLGKQVKLIYSEEKVQGTAIGIDAKGALLCNIGGKFKAINSGEVSVRGLYGYV